MKLNRQEFLNWQQKSITLLGMSGVGKTRLAYVLRNYQWFHYSGDYRIGTHYLDEPIIDNLKQQVMQIPFLRDLLRSDSIHLANNIGIDNLSPLSTFLGKVGDPELGGVGLKEFKRRQELHRKAEIAAMKDVPEFIHKARNVYGYDNFINDAGGSLCELEDRDVLECLAENTLIVYIKASESDEKELIERAETSPKPMYYQELFLDEQLEVFMLERELDYVATIDPNEFVRWVFPRLFYARIPRYEAIAAEFGYTVSASAIAKIKNEEDFISMLTDVLEN
ncbi:MAG: ATPase [Gammaproteobacteria bacterium]|nr:ATPase [Gammaproteobacteria bacterium]